MTLWRNVSTLTTDRTRQVVAYATSTFVADGIGRMVCGQATLMSKTEDDGTKKFRLLMDGREMDPRNGDLGGNVVFLYEFPMDQPWNYRLEPTVTYNFGGPRGCRSYCVKVTFLHNDIQRVGLQSVQLMIPLISGNSQNAIRFGESVVYADQVRRAQDGDV